MNLIFLIPSIILLTCYLLYLARTKDTHLLKSPPQTQPLPRAKVEQALKELNDFKKLPKPQSRKALVEHNSEQFYLERRLHQIQQETEAEQKSYYLACKEREITWQDYRTYFDDLSFFERYISPRNRNELTVLRNFFLESEKKVEREISKFNARTRIRQHEEHVKKQREEEIEQKTLTRNAQPVPNNPDSAEPSEQINENPESSNQQPTELDHESTKEPQPISDLTKEELQPPNNTDVKKDCHFSQADLNSKYPDFRGLTYIDESFSTADSELPLVQDANFDQTYFVSVMFKGNHQYKDCSFRGADFSYSKWQRSESPHRVIGCDFSGAKFNFAFFEYIAFYNCNFEFADFQESQLQLVKFVNCQFENCNIANVDFSQTVMSADMLESIDFSASAFPPKNASSDNQTDDSPALSAQDKASPDPSQDS